MKKMNNNKHEKEQQQKILYMVMSAKRSGNKCEED